MSERGELMRIVEFFYDDVIEEYKEVERQVRAGSGPLSIFKNIDYAKRINGYKECAKQARSIDLSKISISKEDEFLRALLERLEICLARFQVLCGANIEMQDFLMKKAQRIKSAAKFSDVMLKARDGSRDMQSALRELDIAYADCGDELEEE